MRILQVAYYYPPMGGAGVQRALKFSKFLPEFGVQPVVIAAHDPGYMADATLEREVPASVQVHRIAHRPLLGRALALLRRGAGTAHATPDATAPSDAAAAAAAPAARGAGSPPPLLRDAALAAYAALQFPDDKARWAARAEATARRVMREQRIDLLFTSSPPASLLRLGMRLSREFGVPWVADFRDLWTDNPFQATPAWRRAIDLRSERAWLACAAGVVTVTPSWRTLLAERLGRATPVAFIPNGYDEADFEGLTASPRGDGVFRLVHTGTFYGSRDPSALLEGVSAYLRDAPLGAPALRVRLVGEMGSRFGARLASFEQQHPGVIELRPYVPHREALAELMAADALLLVVGAGAVQGAAGVLPGKLFEYLRAGKPVLLLGHAEGDAAELVRRHASGIVADEARPASIADALRALVAAAGLSDGSASPGRGVEAFERRRLAQQLAAFFEQCTALRPRPPQGRSPDPASGVSA